MLLPQLSVQVFGFFSKKLLGQTFSLGGKSLWQLDIKKQAMKDNSPEANKKKKKKAQPDDGSLFKDMPIREYLKGDQLY